MIAPFTSFCNESVCAGGSGQTVWYRDNGHLTNAGAEVSHEPPPEPDAVLTTTTDALLAAFGNDDLRGLSAAGSTITGDPEAVRSLVMAVVVPAPNPAGEVGRSVPAGSGGTVPPDRS